MSPTATLAARSMAPRLDKHWLRVKAAADEVRRCAAVLDDVGRDPSHSRDLAYDDWSDAMDRWRAALKRIQDNVDIAVAIRNHDRIGVLAQAECVA